MLANLRSIAKDYLDRADQFNSYSTEDLANLQAVYNNNASTFEDYQTALNDLVKNGTLLKYGEVTEVAHLSAEKAYYIYNAFGYGAMVEKDGIPTLRNANPKSGSVHYYDCQAQYKAKAKVQDETSNWMILAADKFPGYYYIYNIGAGKYLNPQYNSTFTDTPQPFSITKINGYFVLSALDFKYNNSTQICLAPQFDSSPVSVWNNDEGNYFIIYDNYSVKPSTQLIEQLRNEVYQDARERAGTVAVINMNSTIETYANARPLDFSNVEGLQAYRATNYNASNHIVQLEPTQQAIAKEGLVLRGETGEYEVPYINEAQSGTNLLVGVTEATRITRTSGIYSNFVLTQDNTGKCFVPTQGETIDAQKAYLRIRTANLPSGGESRIALKFGNDLKGDANEDGKVDVADAVVTINKVLGQPASPFNLFNADINDDGIININDVVMTIKIILGE